MEGAAPAPLQVGLATSAGGGQQGRSRAFGVVGHLELPRVDRSTGPSPESLALGAGCRVDNKTKYERKKELIR